MRSNRETVVISCRYHNGNHGTHTPISRSSSETLVAIGVIEGNKLKLYRYLPHLKEKWEEGGGSCIGCESAKVYIISNGKYRERNGRSKEISGLRYRLERSGECTVEELKERAKKLGLPFID